MRAQGGTCEGREGATSGDPTADREWELLRTVMDGAKNVGLAYLDRDLRFLHVNEALARTSGYRPEEMVGRSLLELYPDAEHMATFIRVRDTGEPAEHRDMMFPHPDNPLHSATYWDWTLSPVKDGEGNVIGLVLTLTETTGKKRAEEVLRESEERYRLLHDTMHQGVVFQDEDGKIVSMNPVADRMLGQDPEDFIGSSSIGQERYCIKADGSPFPGEEHPAMVSLRTGQRVEGVIMGVWNPRDADYRWIDITAVPLFQPGESAPHQVYTLFEDITLRKWSEERMRHNQAILKGINCIFREGITASSNKELGLACLNVAEKLTGSKFGLIGHLKPDWDPEDAVMDSDWEAYSVVAPHRNSRFPTNLRLHGVFGRLLSKGEAFYTNDPRSHPDYISLPPGHPGLTAFLGVPLTHGGKVIGMIGLGNKEGGYTDEDLRTVEILTPAIVEALHRKRTEEAMQRSSEDLRRSNAELQQFAYVASHDLREPLRMVSSYIGLLERNYSGKVLDDTAGEYMRFASDGARRMKLMIDDLLRYSRIETRGRALERVDMDAVLAMVLKDLDRAIEESGASVTFDPLPIITADRIQMTQVLQNLVGNAVKFRGDRVPRVHIYSHIEGRERVFSVQDNGIGIEHRHGDRLFLMFQRLHSQAEYEGTGIGLAIVKKIIDRHHGRLWFESTPGQGSTFFFTVPLHSEDLDIP